MHASERGAAVHQLVQEDAQGPDVEGVIVRLVLDHFRRHVLKSAAKSISLLICVRLHAPSEVANFDDVAFLDQNVLGLDVPVD